MKNVKVFTESCIDLLPASAEEFGISVIPDIIIFDDKEYFNNVTIDAPTFYSMLKSHSHLPTTAHPSVGMFMQAFSSAADYDEIICINVTSEMSGTHNTANLAKDILEEEGFKPSIYTFDSRVVSYGLLLFAIEAARMAEMGKSAAEIIERLESMRGRVGVYFVMKSLKLVRKMGRIFFMKALVADALDMKPIMTFHEGLVTDIGVVRGFREALGEIFKHYRDRAVRGQEIYIFHADNENDAEYLAEMIREIDSQVLIHIEWVGPALGVYTGEGIVGIAFHESCGR